MAHSRSDEMVPDAAASTFLNPLRSGSSGVLCHPRFVIMRRLITILVPLIVFVAQVSPAAAKRVALVIGNAAYAHTPKLDNPKNDAADMAAALKALGFEVIEGLDLHKAAFDRKIREFADALSGAEVGLFFYAGHGLQVAGQNYLVPIDAELTTASALDFEMVRLDLVHRTMERETKTNVLFLDACRNNPLARNLARTMGTRSTEIGSGLAKMEAGVGTLISYSTQPGNVALDGRGRNSPFAGSLVRHMRGSSDDLSALLIAVRNDVMKETSGKQVPWEHSSLTGRIWFRGPAPMAVPTVLRLNDAAQMWERIKGSNDIADFEAFRKLFGAANPDLDQLAASRIAALKRSEKPKTAPLPTVPSAIKPAGPTFTDMPAISGGCMRLAASFKQPIALVAGMQLCSADGTSRATVRAIMTDRVVFDIGVGSMTCDAQQTCSFGWPNAPTFKLHSAIKVGDSAAFEMVSVE